VLFPLVGAQVLHEIAGGHNAAGISVRVCHKILAEAGSAMLQDCHKLAMRWSLLNTPGVDDE
jgi:hypothetical protein